VLNIIKGNVSPLGDRLAAGNRKSDILQVLERRRQLGVDQIGVQSLVGNVRERRHRQLLVVDGVRDDVEHAGLCEAGGGASVGSKAEPEALEVEGLDARACHGLRVGVEGELAELE
jgi:hypothetical protein